MKKCLAFIITLFIIVGMIPINVFANTLDCPTLTIEKPTQVTIDDNQQEYLKFVATESGEYRFYASECSNTNKLYFNLYDESIERLTWGYDYLDYELVAGNTYYIAINYYSYNSSNGGEGTLFVNVVRLVSAEGLSIVPHTICSYEGYSYSLEIEFSPENSIIEKITWSSSDSAIVNIDKYGYMTFVSAGTATITATSQNGLVATATVTVKAAESISLDEEKSGNVSEDVIGSVFKFIPEETGVYLINVDSNNYTYTYIQDNDGNWINSEYAYGIELEQQLEAGKTYYICTSYWYDGDFGDYNITVNKLLPATSLEILNGDLLNGFVGETYSLITKFSPDNAIAEGITWSSSDTNIAVVDDEGSVHFVAEGTAIITATTDSGLTDSITINVNVIPQISLDENYTVSIKEGGQEKCFIFTPPETKTYTFAFENASDVYVGIVDEEWNVNSFWLWNSNDYVFNCELSSDNTYKIYTYFVFEDKTGDYKFKISESTEITKLEIVSTPDKMDYIKELEYFSYYGLKIKATLADGTTVDWDYFNSDAKIAGYSVEIQDMYYDNVYDKTVISCGGKSISFKFNIKENPVDHLEIVSGTTKSYIENYNGDIFENDHGEFFYYYTTYPDDAVIKIVYKDGTAIITNVGEFVDGFYVDWYDEQYSEPWVVGSENKSTISYLGHTVNLPITVERNKVASIEVVSGKVTCIENANGHVTDDAYYYNYGVPSDVSVKINYTDGTSKIVGISDYVDGYSFNWDDDQYETPWILGDDNYLTISYLGVTTQLPVSVIANPVERIEINTAPTREYVYGDTEYGYLYSDGEYELYPTDLTGLSFTVYYTDNTSKVFTYDDIVDGKIDGFWYELHYDGYNPEPGNFPVEFEYMGRTDDYTVVLKESTVSSIAVTKEPNKTNYSYNYSPDFIGMEITITYTDGTTKVVTLTEENLVYDYDPWWQELCYKVEVDGYTLNIEPYYVEDVYYIAYYLGASCEIKNITYTDESKEIKAVELDKVSWNGDGMVVKVTYTDDTTETLTLDVVDFNDFEDSRVSGFGKTVNGLLYYYIETDYDENKKAEQYMVFIFYEKVTVEAQNFVPGDIDGDENVNLKDLITIARQVANWENLEVNTSALDVNGDGVVDLNDVNHLARYLAGWGVELH